MNEFFFRTNGRGLQVKPRGDMRTAGTEEKVKQEVQSYYDIFRQWGIEMIDRTLKQMIFTKFLAK